MTFKTKSELNFHPSRNLGYSVYFQTNTEMEVCESCVQKTGFDDDTTFYERPNPENFALSCDVCHELIDCDYPPSDLDEAIERLTKQYGWCDSSARTFSILYLKEESHEKDHSC